MSQRFIVPCSFCQQGQVHPFRCGHCLTWVGICDECELIWTDLKALAQDPQQSAAGSHPRCPACDIDGAAWLPPTPEDWSTAEWAPLVQEA